MASKLKKISPKTNTIYRGDNLELMQAMPDGFVDLCYIDPPFFTQRDYKNIWGDRESVMDWDSAKLDGFFDTKDFFEKHVQNGETGLAAYLVWLRARIIEIHRILKPTGSLYLHLDYHAVNYVKVMLDEIFGYQNFKNEIIWQRKQGSNSTSEPRSLSNNSDTILFYTKGKNHTFHAQYQSYDEDYVKKTYRMKDENGDRYTTTDMQAPSHSPTLFYKYKGFEPPKNGWRVNLAKMKELDSKGFLVFGDKTIRRKNLLKDRKGVPLTNIWLDIGCLQGNSDEKTKWPTQKPVALLERILSMSSNEGDMVFDCFAGCGTTMHAAHKLKRKWVGIDISKTAMAVNQKRLQKLGAKVALVENDDLESEPAQKNSKKAA